MNNRAQSVVVGSILVFAILVLLLGVLQTTLIPSANEEIEFEHSQDVGNDFRSVGVSIDQAAATGQAQAATVKLGVRYPPRLVFLNPGPVSGTVRTTDDTTDEFIITNAEAQNAETANYWDGSEERFDTTALEYQINYNLYRNNPTRVYENSIVYNQFEDGNVVEKDQDIINGRTISLTALSGDLSESQTEAKTVTIRPLSSAQTTVPITDQDPTDGTGITITINTRLTESELKDIFEEELTGGFIKDIECTDVCEIEFQETDEGEPVTYNLQMAKVSVGSSGTEPGAYYLTNVKGDDATVLDTGSTQFVVQVRDKFNNPVSGVAVPFEIPSGEGKFKKSGGNKATVTTDENGRARVTYIAGDNPGTFDINVGSSVSGEEDFISPGEQEKEKTTFDFTVVEASDEAGDIGASINPSGPLQLDSAFTNGQAQGAGPSIACYGSGDTCLVKFTLLNEGSAEFEITEIRYFYYASASNPGSRPPGIPDKIWLSGDSNSDCAVYDFQDPFESASSSIAPLGEDDTETFIIEFRKGSSGFETIAGESFGIALKYENTDTGETLGSTYLISPQLDDSGSEVSGTDAPSSCTEA